MAPSLFALIRAQVDRDAQARLDLTPFPAIPLGPDSNLTLSPGMRDHISIGSDAELPDVEAIVRAVRWAGDPRASWEELERDLDGTSVVRQFDEVYERLRVGGLTDRALARCRELARRSGRYEPVKWGVILGYLPMADDGELSPDDVEFLVDLARHPELCSASMFVLRAAGRAEPHLKLIGVRLLAMTDGWGVVHIVRDLAEEPELMSDPAVQRQVLIYGAENGDMLSMECYFDIARIIDMPAWVDRARGDDDEVFVAIARIMGGLCTEPRPIGGLADRDDADELLDLFLALLEARESRVEVLYSIDQVSRFFAEHPAWPGRREWEARLRALYRDKRSLDVLSEALHGSNAWYARSVIRTHRETDLAAAVAAWHLRDPSNASLVTLGVIGRAEDETLITDPLEAVDWASRRQREKRAKRLDWAEGRADRDLANRVEQLAHWPNHRTERLILAAAQDFNPDLRSAAARAIDRWPDHRLTPALRDGLERLLDDPATSALHAATRAAETHGVPVEGARARLEQNRRGRGYET